MKGRQLRSGADEPLDLILGRGSEWPLDLAGLLQVEVGLATALSDVRQRGLNTERRQGLRSSLTTPGMFGSQAFGIPSRLPREREAPRPPEAGAGR